MKEYQQFTRRSICLLRSVACVFVRLPVAEPTADQAFNSSIASFEHSFAALAESARLSLIQRYGVTSA
jgi:hypothetical protein